LTNLTKSPYLNSLKLCFFEEPNFATIGVDVMIKIFGDFLQFSVLHCLALFLVRTPIFSPNFSAKIYKNYNIGPWSHCFNLKLSRTVHNRSKSNRSIDKNVKWKWKIGPKKIDNFWNFPNRTRPKIQWTFAKKLFIDWVKTWHNGKNRALKQGCQIGSNHKSQFG
jgi:hypothetical protein